MSSDMIKNGDVTALSSAYAYDEDGNVTKKAVTYNGGTADFVNAYDKEGRITTASAFGKNVNYTYDENDQLVSADGDNYNASYSYDARGNITSKLVNGETTAFTYANSGWKDQLVSVNGVELTYDANGNVLTYGDKEYLWNTGRHLQSITDGDNEYTYTYDENGIRTSKTVNDITTYYNTKDGVILSQTDGTNIMYFQYDNSGTPLGFVYNETQYFYVTNQMGDVLGITEANGNLIAQYLYDDWGKLVSIDTADAEGETACLELANANPLRYRGYYFDSETGYYYLQSRYYAPEICRFINADVPVIAKVSKEIQNGVNLFSYCCNSPINDSDPDGKISIKSAFNTILNAIKQRISNYFKQLFSVKNGKVRIAVSLFAAFINGIISALISRVVYKGITSLLKLTVNYASKKAPQKLITAIQTVVKLMETKGFFKIVGNMLIKRALKLPSAVSTFAKDLRDNVIFSGLLNRYKILNRISLVVSMFSSIGGFIATIIDVMDGNWDGYLIFKVSKRKAILL